MEIELKTYELRLSRGHNWDYIKAASQDEAVKLFCNAQFDPEGEYERDFEVLAREDKRSDLAWSTYSVKAKVVVSYEARRLAAYGD